MESMTMMQYLPLASAIIIVSGAIYVAYITHRNSNERESTARFAVASEIFRSTVKSLMADVKPASEHWNNDLLVNIPSISKGIGAAVAKFSSYLSQQDRDKFKREWEKLKNHCKNNIPKARSKDDLQIEGGITVTTNTKVQFHTYVENLLSYATQT